MTMVAPQPAPINVMPPPINVTPPQIEAMVPIPTSRVVGSKKFKGRSHLSE